jgi:hypothetical protein
MCRRSAGMRVALGERVGGVGEGSLGAAMMLGLTGERVGRTEHVQHGKRLALCCLSTSGSQRGCAPGCGAAPQDEGHRSHRSGIFRSSHRRKSRRADVHTATIPRVVERQWEELHKSRRFRVCRLPMHPLTPLHSTPLHSTRSHCMSLRRHARAALAHVPLPSRSGHNVQDLCSKTLTYSRCNTKELHLSWMVWLCAPLTTDVAHPCNMHPHACVRSLWPTPLLRDSRCHANLLDHYGHRGHTRVSAHRAAFEGQWQRVNRDRRESDG